MIAMSWLDQRRVGMEEKVISVQINLNHGLVCAQCESFILKGSDLSTNDRKLWQRNKGKSTV